MAHLLADASPFSHQFLEGPYARVPKEIGCALGASFLVSPLVSIIDKAIVQEITGAAHLVGSIRNACTQLVMQPRIFFSSLSFRLTFLVYFGTYAAANVSEAALDYYKIQEESDRRTYKVSSASAANIGLLSWRDTVFARVFFGGKPTTQTPLRSVSLFALRDTVTMAATFYAAPKVCEYLILEHNVNKSFAEISTSLSIPVLSQFVTAPMHIHAIDYFNRPDATTAQRWTQLKNEFGQVSFARGFRILPAFGFGSYANHKLRELTIRQPNAELFVTSRITRQLSVLNDSLRGYHIAQPIATSSSSSR